MSALAEAANENKPAFRPVFIGLGALLAVGIQFLPRPEGLGPEAWTVVSLAVLMVTWWVTEAIPIPATSLLPLVVLPSAGIVSMQQAAAPYADQTIMLLMGGFILAKSIERWGLHARIALWVVSLAGDNPARLVLGFMVASASISLWISNTATTLMLVPIALSVAAAMCGPNIARSTLPVALLIGVAWSASIGGMGTPVGTPTNLIVIGYLEREFGIEVSFVQWMALGIPTVLLLIPAAWLILTRGRQRIDASLLASGGREVIAQARADLGGWTVPEVRTAIVFGLTALAWIIREPVSGVEILGVKPFAGVTDAVIAIMGAITCFLVPSGSRKEKGTALLEWKTAESIPWGALILFGGGLSLAGAFSSSGLADWLGESFSWVTLMAAIAVIAIMTTVVIFATELMSNVAIATTMMPIMGALAVAGGVDPMLLAAPVGLAASCAFMLPLGTAPNAIVFATGRVTIPTMARLGLWLNFVGIVVITLVCYFLVPLVH